MPDINFNLVPDAGWGEAVWGEYERLMVTAIDDVNAVYMPKAAPQDTLNMPKPPPKPNKKQLLKEIELDFIGAMGAYFWGLPEPGHNIARFQARREPEPGAVKINQTAHNYQRNKIQATRQEKLYYQGQLVASLHVWPSRYVRLHKVAPGAVAYHASKVIERVMFYKFKEMECKRDGKR